MTFTLSLNTNPLVNRFACPDDLINTIANDIGLRDVQLTHEFINPAWPPPVVRGLTRRFQDALARTGLRITSGMTGPYGRLNHFGHPDAGVRRYYVDWFKAFADIWADLGAACVGSQFAILTARDFADSGRRADLTKWALDCWGEVADHARSAGLHYLIWEPMSVGREYGHTLQDCRSLQRRIDAAGLAIPLRMMIDIDHGDVTSADPRDCDPYAWLETFAAQSPIIHIKQSSPNKGGHWPFTPAHNRDGRITPEKLLAALDRGKAENNEICLELSFREREPVDSQVVEMIRQSVNYWAPHLDTGRNGTPRR